MVKSDTKNAERSESIQNAADEVNEALDEVEPLQVVMPAMVRTSTDNHFKSTSALSDHLVLGIADSTSFSSNHPGLHMNTARQLTTSRKEFGECLFEVASIKELRARS